MKNLIKFKSCLTRLRGLTLILIALCTIGVGNMWGKTITETLTSSEISAKETAQLKYGSPVTWTDTTITYTISANSDAKNRNWFQLKANDKSTYVYVKITTPEGSNISKVKLQLTGAANKSGGVNDISKTYKMGQSYQSGNNTSTIKHIDVCLMKDTTSTLTAQVNNETNANYIIGKNTENNLVDSTWLTISDIPASGNSMYLRVSGACRIWNLQVTYETTPTCTPLGQINGSFLLTQNTAVLEWTDLGENVDSYSVTYKVHGAAGEGTTFSGDISDGSTGKKKCTITGLTGGTEYDFTISVNAKDGYCADPETLTGTTDDACAKPTNANATYNSSTDKVNFTWSGDAAGQYEIYVANSNTTPDASQNATYGNITSTSKEVGADKAGTNYWWVRKVCDESTKSAWVAGESFNVPYTISFVVPSGYGTLTGGKVGSTNLTFSGSAEEKKVTNTVQKGDSFTYPTVSYTDDSDCKIKFVGWSTASNTTSAPSIRGAAVVTLNESTRTLKYYAVYSMVDGEGNGGDGEDFDPDNDVDSDFYITESTRTYYMTSEKNSTSYFLSSTSKEGNIFHIKKNDSGKFIISYDNNGTETFIRVYTGSNNNYYINTTTTSTEATALTIKKTTRSGAKGTWEVESSTSNRGLMYQNSTGASSNQHRFANYSLPNCTTANYSLLEFEPVASLVYTTSPSCADSYAVTLKIGETTEAAAATLTVNGNNIKHNGGTAKKYHEGDEVTLVATTAETGYTFKKWNISPDVTYKSGSSATTATTTFTMPAEAVTVEAVFEEIKVTGITFKVSHSGEADLTSSDITLNLYPLEGSNSDPLSPKHVITIKESDIQVLPANALNKTFTWKVTESGTNKTFSTNTIDGTIFYYNKSIGTFYSKTKSGTGTVVLQVTANDGSGVSAKITINIQAVAMTSFDLKNDENESVSALTLYLSKDHGQRAWLNVAYTPAQTTNTGLTVDGTPTSVTTNTNSHSQVSITANSNITSETIENVVFKNASGTAVPTKTVAVTIKPMPVYTFVDYIHGAAVVRISPAFTLTAGDEAYTEINWTITAPAEIAENTTGVNSCETSHKKHVGWIPADYADAHPDMATDAYTTANGFVPANGSIEVDPANGNKTYYAVWAEEE